MSACSHAVVSRSVLVPRRFGIHSSSRHRRFTLLRALASAETPIATDAPVSSSSSSSPLAVRDYLLKAGWELAWIDGVMSEMTRKTLQTDVERVEAALTYLQGLGIPVHCIENMVSLCKPILACEVDGLKAVVDWLESKGLSGSALKELLMTYPHILPYSPSGDGSCLERGRSRASLVFGEKSGKRTVGMQYWREGAAFGQSPVAPKSPK